MKKGIFLFVLLMITGGLLFAQSITMDYIGMHGNGGTSDYEAAAGEVVYVRAQYDPTDMESILGPYYSSTNRDKARIYWYSASSPSGSYLGSTGVTVSNFNSTGISGTDQIATFTVTLPATGIPAGTNSFQIMFGLYGENIDFDLYDGQRYSSNFLISASYPVPLGTPSTGWQSYMTLYTDSSTQTPTLSLPSSPTTATYDNSTLAISYTLPEAALANSVKLYISTNSDGSSPITTLELSSTHEAAGSRTFGVNASAFSTSDSDVDTVTGTTSLTNGTTYYIAIGYRDIVGNTEAVSDWNKLIYDTSIVRPSSLTVTDLAVSDIQINFTLPEDSKSDSLFVVIKNSSLTVVSTVQMSGVITAGTKSFTLDGADLVNSTTPVSDVSGFNSITDNADYYVEIKFYDRAGNNITSFTSSIFHYVATTVTCTITGSEVNSGQPLNGYSGSDWQPIAYLHMITNSSSATLSSVSMDLSGSVSASDFQSLGLGLFYSADATFNVASDTQLDGGKNYASTISFTGLSQAVTTSGCYVFFVAKLDNTVTDTDYIELAMDSADIVMNQTTSFAGFSVTHKYLKPALYVSYRDDYGLGIEGVDDVYYRLDLRTNCGTTSITSVNINLSGTATSEDFVAGSFKIWSSSSDIFTATRATQLDSGYDYDTSITWSGLSTIITSTESYIFFTAIKSDTSVSEHVIQGSIPSSGITATGEYSDDVLGSFPLGGGGGTVLPVELSSFVAAVVNTDDVEITWVTQSETNVNGYYLYKSVTPDVEDAVKFNTMITPYDAELVSTQRTYKFVDIEIYEDVTYWYWLECVDIDGTTHMFGPAVVEIEGDGNDVPQIVDQTKLNSNYPNPFNPDTFISFDLKEQSRVNIAIYDVRGRLVNVLTNRMYDSGRHDIPWNGKTSNGDSLAGGVYFIKMITPDYTGVKKALLLK